MSVRALLRSAGFQPIALPASSRPQYVNEEGFEYDPEVLDEAEDIAEDQDQDQDAVAAEELDEGEGGEEAEEVDGVVGEDEQGDVVMEEDAEDEAEEEAAEPLMSIADSKPRAKPPPKGTFLFPTPPPSAHPLPIPEYHGPLKSVVKPVMIDGTTPASPSGSTPPPLPQAAKLTRAGRPRKSVGIDGDAEPPAHEIECIARCTLSVGPISFPGTEIWIGRFVEPRSTKLKKERAKPGERKEKRKSMAEESAARRARISASSTPRPRASLPAGQRPAPSTQKAQKANTPSRQHHPAPRPQAQSAQASSSAQAGTTSAPPRPTASPQLIQLVNQAASRHPWLSSLIYKAAGSTANQEELERLGKAVARLSRGEPIEDLAPGYNAARAAANVTPTASAASAAGSSRPTQPPAVGPGAQAAASASAPIPASSQIPAAVPASAPTAVPIAAPTPSASADIAKSSTGPAPAAPAILPKDEDSDSDGEPDMKGPPQEGGGPIPPPTATSPEPVAGPSKAASPAPAHSIDTAGGTPVTIPVTINETNSAGPASVAEQSSALTPAPSQPAITQPSAASVSQPSPPPPLPPTPPAPPKPTYPLPPPFLLIAFKEHPTEKFLLPLGLHSFVSRVGGDWVTGPEPEPEPESEPEPQPEPVKSTEEVSEPIIEVKPTISAQDPGAVSAPNIPDVPPEQSPDVPPPAPPTSTRGRGRTRASLGRGAKEQPASATPVPTPAPVAVPNPELSAVPEEAPIPDPIPSPKARPSSGMPALPGMKPSEGTVLVSTFVPTEKWVRVDWETARNRLPFDNPELWDQSVKNPTTQEEVKQERPEDVAVPPASTEVSNIGLSTIPSNTREKRAARPVSTAKPAATITHQAAKPHVDDKPSMFNLSAEDLMPHEGSVVALTIRMEGIDDAAWKRIKGVMTVVEKEDIELMIRREPNLLDNVHVIDEEEKVTLPAATPDSSAPSGAPIPSALSSSHSKLSDKLLEALRPIYTARKKALFSALLDRITPRSFLQTRLPAPPTSELVEASTDKWAPRPYPISTKPLYTMDADDGDAAADEEGGMEIDQSILLSPDLKGKKRKADEPAVTFEMPVSLEALDERVEEGAKRSLSKRGRGGRAGGPGREEGAGGRKKNKRGTEKGTCEGCAREGIKVWRRGPGGRGTLCNACGDLFTVDKLGPLKAPGAMSAINGVEEEGADDEKDDGTEVKAKDETGAPAPVESADQEQATEGSRADAEQGAEGTAGTEGTELAEGDSGQTALKPTSAQIGVQDGKECQSETGDGVLAVEPVSGPGTVSDPEEPASAEVVPEKASSDSSIVATEANAVVDQTDVVENSITAREGEGDEAMEVDS